MAELDHADKGPVADMERRCPCHLQEGPAAQLLQCGHQKGPALSSFRGAWAAETCLSTPGCVLGDSRHPVTERGRRTGLAVWDQRGTLGKTVLV